MNDRYNKAKAEEEFARLGRDIEAIGFIANRAEASKREGLLARDELERWLAMPANTYEEAVIKWRAGYRLGYSMVDRLAEFKAAKKGKVDHNKRHGDDDAPIAKEARRVSKPGSAARRGHTKPGAHSASRPRDRKGGKGKSKQKK